jgi:guanylate kinase
MKRKGFLLVLSAPSGAGKTTICDALLKQDKQLLRSISVTTREPRGQEKHGRDYYFVSPDRFKQLKQKHQFLEWAKVHGHFYGTLKSWVLKQQNLGQDVVLVIDVQGGLVVKKKFPDAVLVFVEPPSLSCLKQRLKKRGTDAENIIQRRLQNARGEMKKAKAYDYRVVNKNLEQAIGEVQAIILAERLRSTRMK